MFLKKAFLALGLSALLCAPVHAAEPVTLKFSHVNAENAWSTENGLIPWMKKVEEDSQGSIRMELYANNTLTKDNQAWMAVRNGIADMAWLPMGRYPGMNPLLEVIGLGGLAYEDAMGATARGWNVLDSVPAAMKPFAANRLIALYSTDTAFLLTRKPVRTLEDLRGMKIRCTSVYVGSLKALGAVPVVLGMPDVYMSLQKGVIDGLICDWESVSGFRLYDEAKYVTDNVPLGMVTFCIAMNQRVYNKLPQKAQQAIDANSGRAGSLWLAKRFSYDSRGLQPEIAPHLREIITLSEAERARWSELVGRPLWEQWLADMNRKGLKDARTALDCMTK